MHKPTINSDATIWRAWLRDLPKVVGKSLTRIAAELGMPPSTLTRPLKQNDPGVSLPHQSTIKKIVERYGVAPPAFAANRVRPFPLRGLQEDAAPYKFNVDNSLDAAVRALIDGKPNVDPWVVKTRSLDLAGYLPGDVVIVDLSRAPSPGDPVCAHTGVDLHRDAQKAVLRLYERAGSSIILLAATVDPDLRAPIAVDERVTVLGVIVGMVRPLRQAA